MMNLKKIKELFFDDEEVIESEPFEIKYPKSKYNFKVSEYEALLIAQNKLTKEYLKLGEQDNSYINLFLRVKDVITRDNSKYYYIECVGGDISGYDGNTFWDGEITESAKAKLKCLINVDTGKYKYIGNESKE